MSSSWLWTVTRSASAVPLAFTAGGGLSEVDGAASCASAKWLTSASRIKISFFKIGFLHGKVSLQKCRALKTLWARHECVRHFAESTACPETVTTAPDDAGGD